MKIEDNRNDRMKFGELIVGDIFTNSAGFYYMKTEKFYSERGKTTSIGDEFNAICLSEDYIGTKVRFEYGEEVIFLNNVTLVLN